ncbi:MAG: FadR family transcriptional regulator, partial [Syntrophaceae bacterium]|nr:FadR family transcriptional regulator [Syntrophaceae bacterium]
FYRVKPIKKIRLSDSVINAIKKKVAENNFKPGDKFYSENELSKLLEVSRSSIREAIRILEATGYVTVRQGKGIFIADFDSQKFEPFVNWLKSNEQHILDHFEVRLIIEPKAAALAAEKADAEDIRKMEEALAQFDLFAERKDNTEIIKWDRKFHRWLAGSTKNSTLHVLMKSVTTSLPNGWISSLHTPGRIEKTTHEHRVILEAIKNRDKNSAEKAMARHLENALSDIRSHMGTLS